MKHFPQAGKTAAPYVLYAVLALLVLGACLLPPAALAAGGRSVPFSDVSTSDPNLVFINYLKDSGLAKGFPDGTYGPRLSLTRAEAVTLLIRATGKETQPAETGFSDVGPDYWASGYISAAAASGIVRGYPDGSFHPDDSISRSEVLAMLFQWSGQARLAPTGSLPPDLPATHWAAGMVSASLKAGLIAPGSDGSVRPDEPMLRGDFSRAMALSYTMVPGTKKTDLKGVVSADKGAVTVTVGGTEKKLDSPAPLQPGMIIKTGKQSSAVLSFEDGSSLRLDENGVLTVKSFEGVRAIRRDGAPISTVGRLRVSLDQGRLTGALSSPNMFAAGNEKGKETTAVLQPPLLALAEKGPQVLRLLAEGENGNGGEDTPWYLTAGNQQTRVEVDMPWGVAGIRGTIWMNDVTDSGQTTTVLFGTVNVTANGVTVSVSNGQGTTITSSNSVPSAPAQMTATEAKLWTALQSWLQQVIQTIDQNMPVNQITFTVIQNPQNDQIQINFSNSMSSTAGAAGTSASNSGGGGGDSVTSANVTLSAGQVLGSYIYSAANVTATLKDSANAALSGKTVQIYQDTDGDGTLEVDRDALLGSGVTGADGSACLYVVLIPFMQQQPGTTLFAYSPDYSARSAAVTVTPQMGNFNYGDPFDVKALLLDQNGLPLSGKSLSMAIAHYPDETIPPCTGSATTGSDGTAAWTVSNYSDSHSLTLGYMYYATAAFAGDETGTNQQNQDINVFFMPNQGQVQSQYVYVDVSLSTSSAVYNLDSITADFFCYSYDYTGNKVGVPNASVSAAVYNSSGSVLANGEPVETILTTGADGHTATSWLLPILPIGSYYIEAWPASGPNSGSSDFQITGNTRLFFVNGSGVKVAGDDDIYAWAGNQERVDARVELDYYAGSNTWSPIPNATVSAEVYDNSQNPIIPSSLTLTTDASGRACFSFNTTDSWFNNLNGSFTINYDYAGDTVSGTVYDSAASMRKLNIGWFSVDQTDSCRVFAPQAGAGNGRLNFNLKVKTASGEVAAPAGIQVNYTIENMLTSTQGSASTDSSGNFAIEIPAVSGLYKVTINGVQYSGKQGHIYSCNGQNHSAGDTYYVEWGTTFLNMKNYSFYSMTPGNHLKAKLYHCSSFSENNHYLNPYYYNWDVYGFTFAGLAGAQVKFQYQPQDSGTWTDIGTAVTDANGDAELDLTASMINSLGLDPTQLYVVRAVYYGNAEFSASQDYDPGHRFTNTILKVFAPNGYPYFYSRQG